MTAKIKLIMLGIALAVMSGFAVDFSANAPLNNDIDRTDPNFVKASLVSDAIGEVISEED